MAKQYKTLPYFSIAKHTKVKRRTFNRPTNVSLRDPAMVVMTDFNEITPFSIEPTASIDATNDKMIACGVRLLFVTDADGSLLGLVTSTDVLGEKPLLYLQQHGGKREDIMVQDIMTAHEKLQVLHTGDITHATVGDIVETMKDFSRQHILVVEPDESIAGETIRGIFSTSQISRQLGITIDLIDRANSFAEIEQVLVSA